MTQGDLTRLPAPTRAYWLVSNLLWGVVTTVAGVAAVLWFGWSTWWLLVPAGIVVLTVVQLILIPLRFRNHGYRVNDREVFITQGRLLLRTVTIATPKILNAVVTEGPIQRRFNLATVTVHQVVGEHEIGPVHPDEAERLRVLILEAAEREER